MMELTVDQRLVANWRPRSWAAHARGLRVRVTAHAGSGKTTALIELAKGLLESTEWLRLSYMCFNRTSAQAARQRFPACDSEKKRGVDCRTLHSALVAFVRRKAKEQGVSKFQCPPRLALTTGQLADILDRDLPMTRWAARAKNVDAERKYVAKLAWHAVDFFCRSADTQFSTKHLSPKLRRAMDDRDRELKPDLPPTSKLVMDAAKVLFRRSADLQDSTIPCTQRVVAKVALNLMLSMTTTETTTLLGWAGFDRIGPHAIMVDEAQDLDECILAILELQRKNATNLIVVGDAAQSIYKFRGASDAALKDSSRLGTATHDLVLKRSFRFGPSIADEANKTLWLKHHFDRSFDYDPVLGCGSYQGEIFYWNDTELPTPPFTCICRTNKGILSAAAMILTKIPDVSFDIGGDAVDALLDKLSKVYNLFHGGQSPDSDLPPTFSALAAAVCATNETFDDDDDDHAVKPVDPILCQATDVVLELKDDIPNLLARIRRRDQQQNTTPKNVVSLVTSHRAKGLEYDTVLVYDDYRDMVQNGDLVPFLRDDDVNLWHVAITRAKRQLWLPPKFHAFSTYLHAKAIRCPGHATVLPVASRVPVAPLPRTTTQIPPPPRPLHSRQPVRPPPTHQPQPQLLSQASNPFRSARHLYDASPAPPSLTQQPEPQQQPLHSRQPIFQRTPMPASLHDASPAPIHQPRQEAEPPQRYPYRQPTTATPMPAPMQHHLHVASPAPPPATQQRRYPLQEHNPPASQKNPAKRPVQHLYEDESPAPQNPPAQQPRQEAPSTTSSQAPPARVSLSAILNRSLPSSDRYYASRGFSARRR